jgi:arylsulfatase A-like enzyme
MKWLTVFLAQLLAVLSIHAGINISSAYTDSGSSGTGAVTGSFSSVSAQVGDVIVLTSATNKKGTSSTLSAAQVGGTGTTGAQTLHSNGQGTYPTAWVWYQTVTTAGTFDYEITGSSITAGFALYVVRADSGQIELAGAAAWDDTDNADNGSSYSLDYTFGASLTDGVLIEAVNARTDLITESVAYTENWNGSNKRVLLSYDGVTGSSWNSVYSVSGGTAGKQTSGAAGVAFSEVSSAPQPPAFTGNPIVESNATTNQAYASSLIDNASDPNGDPMTFQNDGGPGWLTVAVNGDLSGTPQSSDLGTNTWTVSVTDGISGTNSASLKINVVAGAPTGQTSQTNIVFFVIDDLGWMDLSCQGSEFYETPRIDSLAASGIRFTQGYAAHPRCLPSRYGILTGKFPGANGVPGGPENCLRPADVTMAEALQAGGYATFFGGKYHLIGQHGTANLPQNQGFDINISGGKAGAPPTYFFPYKKSGEPDPADELNKNALFLDNTTPAGGTVVDRITGKSYVRTADRGAAGEYITDRLTDEALDWMESNADQPFFLYFSHYGVHTPYEAPQSLINKYTTKLATMDYGTLPEYISSGVGQQKMRQDFPTYAAMIESVDQSVGRVLDKLEELGITSNTVVMFTSDNGGLSNRGGYNNRELATANYPLRTGKGWLYEGGIREPFIVKWPGVTAAGINSNAVVNGTDFYPTMLEMAGLPLQTNDHQDGVSFVPALQGQAFDRGEPIFWHSPLARPYSTGDFKSSAVREGDYKLIWFYGTPGQPYELYNVKTDIGENNDLSEAMPAKATELLGKIQAWHAGAHEGLGVIFKTDDNAVSKPPHAYLDDPTAPANLEVSGGTANLSWGDYLGFDYQLYSKTNLLDATWTLEDSGLTTTNSSLSTPEEQGFYKLELVLQPEI